MKPIHANELLAGLTLARPVPITAVVTDSRRVTPGCVFVCFRARGWMGMTLPPRRIRPARNISSPTIPLTACPKTTLSLPLPATAP